MVLSYSGKWNPFFKLLTLVSPFYTHSISPHPIFQTFFHRINRQITKLGKNDDPFFINVPSKIPSYTKKHSFSKTNPFPIHKAEFLFDERRKYSKFFLVIEKTWRMKNWDWIKNRCVYVEGTRKKFFFRKSYLSTSQINHSTHCWFQLIFCYFWIGSAIVFHQWILLINRIVVGISSHFLLSSFSKMKIEKAIFIFLLLSALFTFWSDINFCLI